MVRFDSALCTLGECTWGEPVQQDHTNELLCIGGIGTNDGEDGIGNLKNWNITTAADQGRFIIIFHSWCTEFHDIFPYKLSSKMGPKSGINGELFLILFPVNII